MARRLLLLPPLLLAAACTGGPRPLEPPFASVDGGGTHACGVDREGRAWCWGESHAGALGAGAIRASAAPVRLRGSLRFREVRAGDGRTCGLDLEGLAWCWGENAAPPAGAGLKALEETARDAPTAVPDLRRYAAIDAGGLHACALDEEGGAWCWGANLYGEVGDGTRDRRWEPARVAGDRRYAALAAGGSHTCALDADGAAWCWGANDVGQLGTGTTEASLAPVRVDGPPLASLASAGRRTCGLDGDGRPWCWGADRFGALSLRPAPLADARGLRGLAVGADRVCGIDDRGRGRCWGRPGEEPRDLRGRRVAAITLVGDRACAIGAGGEAACWPDPFAERASRDLSFAVFGGAAVAALLAGWRRRVVPTWLVALVAVALLGGGIALLVPLVRFYGQLASDDTGWFFLMELGAGALIVALAGAMLGFVGLLVRLARDRRAL